MSTPTFRPRRGAEAAEQAAKAGPSFARTHFFSIKAGQSEILRFLIDSEPHQVAGTDPNDPATWHWLQPGESPLMDPSTGKPILDGAHVVVAQHSQVTPKPPPDDFKGNWPQAVSAVCRHDQGFGGFYPDCYLCDVLHHNPSPRVWSLAVVVKEVNRNGQIGYVDDVREVSVKDGDEVKTVKERAIVVVNQGHKNFFSPLRMMAGHYGTLLDQDFRVMRTGSGPSDTNYQFGPMGQRAAPGTSDVLDLRNPEHHAIYDIGGVPVERQLDQIVAERATDEYYHRFFVPDGGGPGASAPSSNGGQTQASSVDQDARLQQIQRNLTSSGLKTHEEAAANIPPSFES